MGESLHCVHTARYSEDRCSEVICIQSAMVEWARQTTLYHSPSGGSKQHHAIFDWQLANTVGTCPATDSNNWCLGCPGAQISCLLCAGLSGANPASKISNPAQTLIGA